MPESSLILQLLWQSAVVPLAVALAVLAAGRALRLDAVGAVLAVALAFIASYFAVYFLMAGKISVPINSRFLRILSNGMPPKSICAI